MLPLRPTILDYDQLAQRWIEERVLSRRHRTTGRIVAEAWAEERRLLTPVSVATSDSPSVATKFPTDGHDVAGG